MAQPVSLTLTGIAISPWKNLDFRANPFNAGLNCTVTGTVTFNIEVTTSDYLTPGTTVNLASTAVAGASASTFLAIVQPVRAWRLNILSGTGSVTVDAVQSGY